VNASLFIAKRYIEYHRKNGFLSFITFIAILGVTLGTAALIITLSILEGFEREIKEKVISFTSHIEVRGYQNEPLGNSAGSIEMIEKEVPGIASITPFAARECLIRSKTEIDGVFIKGIENEEEMLISKRYLMEGEFSPEDENSIPGIVIGERLAVRLNCSVGDTLILFAMPGEHSVTGQPIVKKFKLTGVYESGMAEFDDIYAYAALDQTQNLLGLGSKVSGYEVYVKNISEAEYIAEKIQKLLGYPHTAKTVFRLYRNLFSWVELQQKMSPVMLGLIIVVATINIIGTLLMFVLEKTRAIGILKAIGADRKLIRRIFLLQGFFIAFAGIALGNILAFALCWLQKNPHLISIPSDIYYMDTVPISMGVDNFIIVSAIALLLCMATTMIPTQLAAKLDAVTALRFG
jgi:lipoprotein-releasing system permease protein